MQAEDQASNKGTADRGFIKDTTVPNISNVTLTNKTTSKNSYVKNGDSLELSVTISDTNLADITSSDITANLSALGGSTQTNPNSFDKLSGVATWMIIASQTGEGFIQLTVDAKDQAGNVATTVTKTIEADNSIPQAKADYFTTIKNTPIFISSALVLINDTDSSGDILQVLQGADFIFTPQADFIGTVSLSYTVTDGANVVTGTIYIIVTPDLGENEKTLQPVTELGPEDKKIVVVDTPFESTINVSSGTSNATLDLSNIVTSSETEKAAVLIGKINVNVNSNIGNLNLQLPEAVSIAGPASWNGNIKVPTVLDKASFKINPAATTTALIEVGSDDAKLILSKAARLVIPNQASQKAGWIQAGVFTPINTVCESDNQAKADDLPAGGNCKIDAGSDLVIWTKHFTKFITYTESPVQSGNSSNISSNSSSGGSDHACVDAKPGSAPKLLSAKATAVNEVTLSWSKAQDPVTYYLISYGLQKGKVQFGNPNAGDKNTFSFTVKGLSGNTTYYFKVRAGNHCMPGEFSNEMAVQATGKTISKAADGFTKDVLSTKKDAKIISSVENIKPASNVLDVIREFLLKLLSDLQSLSYLPNLRRPLTGTS